MTIRATPVPCANCGQRPRQPEHPALCRACADYAKRTGRARPARRWDPAARQACVNCGLIAALRQVRCPACYAWLKRVGTERPLTCGGCGQSSAGQRLVAGRCQACRTGLTPCVNCGGPRDQERRRCKKCQSYHRLNGVERPATCKDCEVSLAGTHVYQGRCPSCARQFRREALEVRNRADAAVVAAQPTTAPVQCPRCRSGALYYDGPILGGAEQVWTCLACGESVYVALRPRGLLGATG